MGRGTGRKPRGHPRQQAGRRGYRDARSVSLRRMVTPKHRARHTRQTDLSAKRTFWAGAAFTLLCAPDVSYYHN